MRLIHTADWQIGKVFRFVDAPTMSLLQDARLAVIATLAELARRHDARTVLVAGDVFDQQDPAERVLRQALERLREHGDIAWHLIPGNHDFHHPHGPWERLRRLGLPDHVHLHLAPAPMALGERALLLPAPLCLRHQRDDASAWMDDAATPAGVLRIGLAHGSIRSFGSEPVDNPIAADRPARAGLDYLALGDWHGQQRVGERCWYAGTPETDAFGQQGSGQALLVEIAAPGAVPAVTPLATGRYRWQRERLVLHELAALDAFEARLRQQGDLARLLLELTVEGSLPLAERAVAAERLEQALGAALCHLRLDAGQLHLRPAADDLGALPGSGVVREAALRLHRLAEDREHPDHAIARRALEHLLMERRKLAPADP